MSVAISVTGLGKCYQIRHQSGASYDTLRDALAERVSRLLRRMPRQQQESFWALQNVDFEVRQGERVGIIGHNGAGKSTLLKLLSRITEPTRGSILLRGRVASLLEVGTGFHPELTGRDNILLNGAILGMSRQQVRQRFEQIVAFAEVERFLDTPVKRYSSGMYARLAFAVAAHLDADILLVDEVLAVGDIAFQQKCLGKMQEVSEAGRTVLFVSHQMGAIQNLCERCLVLDRGSVAFIGTPKQAIRHYLDMQILPRTGSEIPADMPRTGSGVLRLTGFSVEDNVGQRRAVMSSGDSLVLALDYQIAAGQRPKNVSCGVSLHTMLGERLFVLYSDYTGVTFDELADRGTFRCRIPDFPFAAGRYLVRGRVTANGEEADWPRNPIGHLMIEAADYFGSGRVPRTGIGPVLVHGDWSASDR